VQTSSTTVIARPVTDVWEALADHRGISRWAPGLRVTVDDSAATVPGGVGAVRRIAARVGPTVVERITAFEPGRRLAYEALGGLPFRGYRGVVDLRARGAAETEVTWTLSARPRVPVLERLALAGVTRLLLSRFAAATCRSR